MPRRPFKKRLLSSPFFHALAPFLVSLIVRFVFVTARVERHFPEVADPYVRGEKPAVFCFWHGRMIMHLMLWPKNRPMFVLSSRHNDGALIVATMRWFGIGTVRSTKNPGSPRAVRELLKVTQQGGNISFTPDGPRGPFQQAAQGAAFLACKTGYPLVPVTFSATYHKRLRSWDRFMVPLPFTRVVFVMAEPLTVTSEADIAAATEQLTTALTRITDEADRIAGVTS